MMIAKIRLVFFERLFFYECTEVVEFLRPLVSELDDQEDYATKDRDGHVPPKGSAAGHLERRPREHDRDRRGEEDGGVHRPDGHVEKSVRPQAGLGIEPQKNVGG